MGTTGERSAIVVGAGVVGDGSGTLFMHGPNIALELERLLHA